MDIASKIDLYHKYCLRVPTPMHGSPDTPHVMHLLLENMHFISICDLAFGPMLNPDAFASASALAMHQEHFYWMDAANNSPEGSPLCEKLMELLGPEGSLHSIMRQVSEPNTRFLTRLRGQWKHAADQGREGDDFRPADGNIYRETFDIPLRAFCDFSYDILNESSATDLSALSADQVFPLMLVPFWEPPLQTRVVRAPVDNQPNGAAPYASTSGGASVNLAATMFPYFLIRMLMYGYTRAHVHGTEMLRPTRASGGVSGGLSALLQRMQDTFFGSDKILRPATKSMHFYQRLVLSYLQYLAAPSVIERFAGRDYWAKAEWSEREVAALVVLQGPATLWLQRSNRITTEYQRTPLSRPADIAVAAQSLWYLEAAYVTLTRHFARAPQAIHAIPGQERCAVGELTAPLRACYRSALIAIRQVAMSLPLVGGTPVVFRDLIRLWRALVTPPEGFTDTNLNFFVVSRFEAFGHILEDIFKMVAGSAFASVADVGTIQSLIKGLKELQRPAVHAMLLRVSEAKKHLEREGVSAELERLTKGFVLSWGSGGSALPRIVAPLGAEGRKAACKAAAAIQLTMERTSVERATSSRPPAPPGPNEELDREQELDRLCATLAELYPALENDVREFLQSGRGLGDTMSGDRSSMGGAAPASAAPIFADDQRPRVLSVDDRRRYLEGQRIGMSVSRAGGVAFPGATVSAESYEVAASHEIPLLLPLVRTLDAFIQFVFFSINSANAPRCPKRHVMSLVADSRVGCARHVSAPAVWECQVCRWAACEGCSSPPVIGRAMPAERCSPAEENIALCDRCRLLLRQPHAVAYRLPSNGNIWCAGCAARPWPRVSVRFLASMNTYIALTVVGIFIAILLVLEYFFTSEEVQVVHYYDY